MLRKLVSESFGDALIEYQSQQTNLRITRDRGIVSIDFNPRSKFHNSWFGLGSLLEYLAPDADAFELIYPVLWDEDHELMERQMGRLAWILRQHCEPILSGKFTSWKKVEKRRLKQVRQEYWDSTGKSFPK